MTSVVHRRTIFIVDDDAAVRDSLALFFSLKGFATAVFACAEDFLGAVRPGWQGCVIADIRMPGMSGLDMHRALTQQLEPMPLIVVTGHGSIASARQAFKQRAVDFLEKPFDHVRLMQAVEQALSDPPPAALLASTGEGTVKAMSLTERERQVMSLVIDGVDNRSIGARLGISPRTVEVHKARVMSKLGARNLSDLIRIARANRLLN